MKSKKLVIRVISTMLLLCTILTLSVSMVACKKTEETPVETGTVSTDGSELAFGKENYGKELKMLYHTSSTYVNYFFDEVTEAGELMRAALEERRLLVEDYLGVRIVGEAAGTSVNSVYEALSKAASSGDDVYQVALTHCYGGLTKIAIEGYVKDLYGFDDISLNDEYWNVDAMESLEIGGKAYYGMSDYMINDVCAVFYNKQMYKDAKINEDLYDLVRNGEWTLEKLQLFASKVAVNTGDLAWDKNDTYGFAARADWEFIPLIDSCEVQCLTGASNKILNMGPNNQRYQSLFEICEKIADAEWSYMYNWGDDENKVTIADNRFMFTLDQLRYAPNYLSSGVDFGVLPYPKYDKEQKDHHSLDAGGMICVPSSVRDDVMVGKTLECLAYFSADTVHTAYYERLLGSRVAEAPDDAEMLSEYIFGKVVLNPAYNYSEKANVPLGVLIYTIPKMLRAKLNGTEIDTISTNWASYRLNAQKVIDNTLNKK